MYHGNKKLHQQGKCVILLKIAAVSGRRYKLETEQEENISQIINKIISDRVDMLALAEHCRKLPLDDNLMSRSKIWLFWVLQPLIGVKCHFRKSSWDKINHKCSTNHTKLELIHYSKPSISVNCTKCSTNKTRVKMLMLA